MQGELVYMSVIEMRMQQYATAAYVGVCNWTQGGQSKKKHERPCLCFAQKRMDHLRCAYKTLSIGPIVNALVNIPDPECPWASLLPFALGMFLTSLPYP
jgi:hypothetical protein